MTDFRSHPVTAFSKRLALTLLVVPLLQTSAASSGGKVTLDTLLDSHVNDLLTMQIESKGIPALSVTLVDNRGVLWARDFGYRDLATRTPIGRDTLFRIGSITKLFTAIMIMQQVETGRIELDAPISDYLPDFKPDNPFGKPITVRQLLLHTGGLVRESPVGSYFENTGPSVKESVQSINRTRILTEPGTLHRYSNAGFSALGYLLEQLLGKPYRQILKEKVFDPVGMSQSRLVYDGYVKRHLAQGLMKPCCGPAHAAPVFDLGSAPAGGIYATSGNLAAFASALLKAGQAGDPLLKAATLRAMWQAPDNLPTRGLGFALNQVAGRITAGHGGTIYGFASELEIVPEENLGVVVYSTHDLSNAFASRVARYVLELVLANRYQQTLPVFPVSRQPDKNTAQRIAGYYASADGTRNVEIAVSQNQLVFHGLGLKAELRQLGDHWALDEARLFIDDIQIDPQMQTITFGPLTFQKRQQPNTRTADRPFADLAGFYGGETSNSMQVFVKNGKLHTGFFNFLIEPVTPVGKDLFAFSPGSQILPMQTIRFMRDSSGRVTQADIDGMVLKRLPAGGHSVTEK